MTNSSYVCKPMPSVARCWWGVVKATAIVFVIASLFATMGSGTVSAQQDVFYLEDWDTTPEVPDALRGWRDGTSGDGYLAFEEGRGNYIRNFYYVGIPFFFSTFDSANSDQWLVNEFVGDKDYRSLRISRITFEARFDEAVGFSSPFAYTSVILRSASEVENPDSPGTMVRPAIWTHSQNSMELNGGWQSFDMGIPYDASSPINGWHVFPETTDAWAVVMQDVDAIQVCFCHYFPGIGGALAAWNAGLDNFTVYQGDPIGAQPVPALDRNGIIALIALFGLLAAGWWLRFGREM